MNWIQKMIYAVVSGLTEFLPVSSQAHQVMLLRFFGQESAGAFFQLLIHVACLLALVVCFREDLAVLAKELRISQIPKRRRVRQPNKERMMDMAYVRMAVYALTAGFFCYPYTSRLLDNFQWISLFLVINGLILLLPMYIRQGNKNALSMTPLDGLFFGISAGAGVIPGISRIGVCMTAAAYSGADRQNGLRWALMLSIPALAFYIGFDIRDIFLSGTGLESFLSLFSAIIFAVFAYIGAHLGILLLRFLSIRVGYSGFSYYCWGFALLMLVLFLI